MRTCLLPRPPGSRRSALKAEGAKLSLVSERMDHSFPVLDLSRIRMTWMWKTHSGGRMPPPHSTPPSPSQLSAKGCPIHSGGIIIAILILLFLLYLLTCMCAKLLQSCPILCDPMDCSPSVSSVLLDFPGIEPASLVSPVLAVRFFTPTPPGKPIY